MSIPYYCILLALNYIGGRDIKHWKSDQIKELEEKTTRANNPTPCTKEPSWNEFLANFICTYTDTAKSQTAYHQLQQCKMKGDDLDGYIARFQHWAVEAGFDCDASATVSLFAQGLKKKLVSNIVNWEGVTHTTFDKWVGYCHMNPAAESSIQAIFN